MKTFSVARAFSAGVDLIERKPWTIVWWAGAILVLEIVPRLVASWMTGADEMGAMRDFVAAIGHPQQFQAAQERLHTAQSALGPWGFVISLWSLFVSAIVYNAAFRSVLEPQKSGWGYLRIGVAEFWQFVVLFFVGVLVLIYAVVAFLYFMLLTMIAGASGQPAGGWIFGIGLGILVVVTFWLGLRLALGSVATYARKKFAYFDSWALTKGVSWRLFWTFFLTTALLIGLYVMFLFSLILSLLPVMGMVGGAHEAEVVAAAPPHLPAAADLVSLASLGVLVWVLLASLISSLIHAFTLTPWAVVYKGLTEGESAH
jgi:hypothetical protein